MIKIRQIKISVNEDSLNNLKDKIIEKLKIKKNDLLEICIIKKSLDARKKPLIFYIYEVDVTVLNEENILLKNSSNDILYTEKKEYTSLVSGTEKINEIYIVGAGPAGLMCAYNLTSLGFKVIILERGEAVEQRVESINKFWETGVLLENSNVQFGEGGAGTFSDGKLNTLIKDKEKRGKYVFETLISCGAPRDILYDNKPHIGTDLLRNVIVNLREKIKNMGGTFLYNTCLTNIIYENNRICKIEINHSKSIDVKCVILAIGHSARDTYEMLHKNKINMESKPFAVGFRIMHPQSMINKSQIGVETHPKLLEQSYKLTCNSNKNRGVYTFCMCPGGYVVNASSEKNKLVINGMSNHKRESKIANSAVIATVNSNDFGNDCLSGIEFQRTLEQKTYNLANGKIPIQTYKDFKDDKISTQLGSINPQIKGKWELSNLRSIFNEEINNSIIDAIEDFGRKIKGFNSDDCLLAAVESRTSSPVRILRNEQLESSINNLFVIGEGAGYAGGITSSAIDGLKCSEEIAKIYTPRK